jgi:hypothetical protein
MQQLVALKPLNFKTMSDNNFNHVLYEWKQSQNPVKVSFVKSECTTILVKDAEGDIHRVKKNRIWADNPDFQNATTIEARKEDLNGDYLNK